MGLPAAMLGISTIRFPGFRCIKKNTASIISLVSSEERGFLALAFVIFLLLFISLFSKLLAEPSGDLDNDNHRQKIGKGRPVVSHKQLLELQSPGNENTYLYCPTCLLIKE